MGHQLPAKETLEFEVVETQRALEQWRRDHRAPNPIPTQIWNEAVRLASKFGVGPVSTALRLDHARLKNRVGASTAVSHKPTPQAFVELFSSDPVSSATPGASAMGCVLQLNSGRGHQARLEVTGLDAAGLVSLIRELI